MLTGLYRIPVAGIQAVTGLEDHLEEDRLEEDLLEDYPTVEAQIQQAQAVAAVQIGVRYRIPAGGHRSPPGTVAGAQVIREAARQRAAGQVAGQAAGQEAGKEGADEHVVAADAVDAVDAVALEHSDSPSRLPFVVGAYLPVQHRNREDEGRSFRAQPDRHPQRAFGPWDGAAHHPQTGAASAGRAAGRCVFVLGTPAYVRRRRHVSLPCHLSCRRIGRILPYS